MLDSSCGKEIVVRIVLTTPDDLVWLYELDTVGVSLFVDTAINVRFCMDAEVVGRMSVFSDFMVFNRSEDIELGYLAISEESNRALFLGGSR
jgi:hypothetical protein